MKGNDEVIELLNEVLTAELTAINQYFIHAKMCQNWGFKQLADFTRKESIDEMRHAEELMDRILYLEGVPNVQRLYKVNVGETVKEQFECDLAVEKAAIERLTRGIELCWAKSDHGSRDLLEKILNGEEDHADWLETQLGLIRKMGIENYVQHSS